MSLRNIYDVIINWNTNTRYKYSERIMSVELLNSFICCKCYGMKLRSRVQKWTLYVVKTRIYSCMRDPVEDYRRSVREIFRGDILSDLSNIPLDTEMRTCVIVIPVLLYG